MLSRVGLGGPDGIRMEGMGNLFVYEGWEEDLGEIGVEVIRLATD